MNAAEILVIILSIFLAIFLLIGIVLGVLLIRVSLQIKKVTESAERTAQSIEKMATSAGQASSRLFLGGFAMKAVKKLVKRKRG